MMIGDLRRCEDCKGTAKDYECMKCFVMEALSNVNDCMETPEKERKDVMTKPTVGNWTWRGLLIFVVF